MRECDNYFNIAIGHNSWDQLVILSANTQCQPRTQTQEVNPVLRYWFITVEWYM